MAEAANLQAEAANLNLRPKQPTSASRSRVFEGMTLGCEAARVEGFRHHCANDWDRHGIPQHRPDLVFGNTCGLPWNLPHQEDLRRHISETVMLQKAVGRDAAARASCHE